MLKFFIKIPSVTYELFIGRTRTFLSQKWLQVFSQKAVYTPIANAVMAPSER